MAKRFTKISSSLWRSKRFIALSDDAKLVFIYLLTSEHITSAGCCRLPDGYALVDLNWTPDRYRSARQELVDSGMVVFDTATSDLFVTGWFRHSPAMNQSHQKSIERCISEIESDAVRERAEEEFDGDGRMKAAVPIQEHASSELQDRILGRGRFGR